MTCNLKLKPDSRLERYAPVAGPAPDCRAASCVRLAASSSQDEFSADDDNPEQKGLEEQAGMLKRLWAGQHPDHYREGAEASKQGGEDWKLVQGLAKVRPSPKQRVLCSRPSFVSKS